MSAGGGRATVPDQAHRGRHQRERPLRATGGGECSHGRAGQKRRPAAPVRHQTGAVLLFLCSSFPFTLFYVVLHPTGPARRRTRFRIVVLYRSRRRLSNL